MVTRAAVLFVLGTLSASCAVVPQNRRVHVADPMVRFDDDTLDSHRKQKLYSTREAAAGGDSHATGAGCSCH